MMHLSRLSLNTSRIAVLWASNPYRVHQRLMMACDSDPRLLFRIEDTPEGTQVLVQSHVEPNWVSALGGFDVLRRPPEHKVFDLHLQPGRRYRFRLLANPTAVKTTEQENGEKKKARLGLLHEQDQLDWLKRKLNDAGASVVDCLIVPRGLQHSHKGQHKDEHAQTHLAVLFEGVLQAQDPDRLQAAIAGGIGPAKGYGFGLLSLALT